MTVISTEHSFRNRGDHTYHKKHFYNFLATFFLFYFISLKAFLITILQFFNIFQVFLIFQTVKRFWTFRILALYKYFIIIIITIQGLLIIDNKVFEKGFELKNTSNKGLENNVNFANKSCFLSKSPCFWIFFNNIGEYLPRQCQGASKIIERLCQMRVH